jgi:hypothetical protein
MSQQTAPSRCSSAKPGGSHALRGGDGAVSRLLALRPALKTGPTGPGQPPERADEPEKDARTRAGHGTMSLHGPAAEPGQVIWEMSVEEIKSPQQTLHGVEAVKTALRGLPTNEQVFWEGSGWLQRSQAAPGSIAIASAPIRDEIANLCSQLGITLTVDD